MTDLGKAQVDAALFEALRKASVEEPFAKELARLDVFGGAPVFTWMAGLKAAAVVMNGGTQVLDAGTLPVPWESICPILLSCNGSGPGAALVKAIEPYSAEVQEALVAAIGTVAAALAAAANAAHQVDTSKRITPERAAAAVSTATYIRPIDPNLVRAVQTALRGKGDREQRRKAAGEQLVDWLASHGRFVQVPVTGTRYYLFRDTHRLYNLDSDAWHAWLYRATGSNPASTDFRYFAADCQTAAHDGEQVSICRLAHWDGQMLRVSRFDGTVYRLDGETIELEVNGDGPVIFEDSPAWSSYTPDYTDDGTALDWYTRLLNCDEDPEVYRYALKVFVLALFFTELCPTQVLFVLRGEAGSGKSMVLRVLMRLLFGPLAQIAGVPDKPDGFTASAAASHLLVLDNLDEPADWLRDKLARITTGGIDHYRRLYTSNDLGTVVYRCWVAITARTPDTLRRDDLADRILMVPVSRIDEKVRRRESSFLFDTVAKRSQFWGDLLLLLNRVVASIRREGIPQESGMRMADFEALGRTIARADGQDELWERVVKDWGRQQAVFLLEDSVITEALDSWLKTPTNRSRRVDTRTLFQESESSLFGTNRPDKSWPRSARSFGRTLKALRRSLQGRFKVTWWDSPYRTYYEFDLLS